MKKAVIFMLLWVACLFIMSEGAPQFQMPGDMQIPGLDFLRGIGFTADALVNGRAGLTNGNGGGPGIDFGFGGNAGFGFTG
ncbi:hypothetical protein NPIL_626921 [Nephila pilipes]|uniref:Uncharacterized protein n=1 Tax=Nephila pilipes TaxID=299642 RepID=A0A8X6PIM4_NEPPI|nr:hypothetical protein NPIL_162971 [Nephila pilipes]GFT68653.1 hypothetical protein NPIL_626921 [Nephila pilipes]